MPTADSSGVYTEGPWTHRFVQANGARIHVVHRGEHRDDRPLILMVHGFPEYWWTWRHLIEPVADAGYEVAAIDQRGAAGSDKTPDSADSLLLTEDLLALVRSLGAQRTVIVGHGRGGMLAWSAAAMAPDVVQGIVTVSAPHPAGLHRIGGHITLKSWAHVLSTVTPLMPTVLKRKLTDTEALRQMLASWSAPNNGGAADEAEKYAAALRLPEAADSAIDQLRWSYMARTKINGRVHRELCTRLLNQPVLALRGDLDPLLPLRAWHTDIDHARGDYRLHVIRDAGHFIQEEQPQATAAAVLDFLAAHAAF